MKLTPTQDNGVEKLSKGVLQASLAEIAEIVSGYGFPKHLEGKTEGDLPFFKVGDISRVWNRGEKILTQAEHYISSIEAEQLKTKVFPKGTVVFAKIGEALKLNRRAILGQPSIVDNNVMGLIPRQRLVESLYLYYYMLTVKLGDISQATTVPSVRKSDVEAIAVPLVPIELQKYIVAEIEKYFSRLDEAVASLKRVKSNLKRYKAAFLKAAVEGKLTEVWRTQHAKLEPASKLLERILVERRAKSTGQGKYKEPVDPDTTNLWSIPNSWSWATLEQLCPRFIDSAHRTPRYGQKGVPALGPRDVVGGRLNVIDARLVNEAEYLIQTARHVPEAGDIIYSRELSLGWGHLVHEFASPKGCACLGRMK